MRADERPVSRAATFASLLLALLPPARMAWIVFTYGENNLSNDYIGRVPLVASMLDGTCSIAKFVRGAWIGGGHSLLALTPIYYLNARFLAWDVRAELALGLLIAGATLALVAATLPTRRRWMLLPVLSLLLFSTTKVSSFTFGESTLQMGLAQLGIALGAFGCARRGGRPIALAGWTAAGGVLASWSWGGGIVAWPVFAAALFLLRVRSPAAWALFLSGAVAGLAQYAWLLPAGHTMASLAAVSWAVKGRLVLDVIGRPLVNGIAKADLNPVAQAIGAGGLIALVAALIVLRRTLREQPTPLLLIAWTLLVALQIATFRTAVAAWYASPMALFWAGLLVLFAATPAPFGAGGILAVALLALAVQPTWEDKSMYLPSRAPASAACLREWRTTLEPCHDRLFQWGGVNLGEAADLAIPLERLQLSVFSARRTYLLQGDFGVGRVAFETPGRAAFFSRDGVTHADPNDFHRLDLVLAPGAGVSWRVDLPAGARRVVFSTVVQAAPGDTQAGRGAQVVVAAEGAPVVLHQHLFIPRETARPWSIDLSPLAGKRITLRLAAEETHEGGTPLVIATPKIDIRIGG